MPFCSLLASYSVSMSAHIPYIIQEDILLPFVCQRIAYILALPMMLLQFTSFGFHRFPL